MKANDSLTRLKPPHLNAHYYCRSYEVVRILSSDCQKIIEQRNEFIGREQESMRTRDKHTPLGLFQYVARPSILMA